MFQVPCQKKTGSVGRLYFFFFFYFFFFANSTKQFFPSSPKKYRQCHQAVDPGDMYYGRSFINSGKSRDPASLGHPLTRLHRSLIISKPIIIGVYAVSGDGGICHRLSAVSHNTVSFESMSMLRVSTVFVYATCTEYNMLQRLAGNGVKRQ